MGAGYETRAYGDLHREHVTFFELDQSVVQQHKRAMLAQAGFACETALSITRAAAR